MSCAELILHPAAQADTETSAPDADVVRLMELLGEWQSQLDRLVELAGDKLVAMRQADTAALETYARAEEQQLQLLLEAQRERAVILARVAQQRLRNGGTAARLTDIADALEEPHASALRARSVGLQRAAADLQEKNRLAVAVARNLNKHLQSFFSEIVSARRERVGYAKNGSEQHVNDGNWFDALV